MKLICGANLWGKSAEQTFGALHGANLWRRSMEQGICHCCSSFGCHVLPPSRTPAPVLETVVHCFQCSSWTYPFIVHHRPIPHRRQPVCWRHLRVNLWCKFMLRIVQQICGASSWSKPLEQIFCASLWGESVEHIFGADLWCTSLEQICWSL